MATRTTSTRTTSSGPAPSATTGEAPTFEALVQAYFDCRRTKRNTASALAFEERLERNLVDLYDELVTGEYRPGRSVCFVVTRPKPREIWAAEFRDRIVHHLLYNHVGPRIERKFIADSCACIPGRGTLYAAKRLEGKIRSATQNWMKPGHYLKCDLANFFVSIDKRVLRWQLANLITEPWWWDLTDLVLMHDPRSDYEVRGPRHLLRQVPSHKRLTNQPSHLGLPIGNLSSQFFANIYLNDLDQFVKHRLHVRHYIRYVDDFVLLHRDPDTLNWWHDRIEAFLPRLGAQLNPRKTVIQPIARGVDFVGHVIKPWRRTIRRRTMQDAIKRVTAAPEDELRDTANSYFGLLGQASHSHADRAKLARAILRRGRSVNADLSKTYRTSARHSNKA